MSQSTKTEVQIGSTESDPSIWIEVTEGGPYRVHGAPPLHIQTIEPNAQGHSWTYRQGRAFEVKDGTTLCRCGQSKNKPYCDGSHVHANVDLTERAPFEPMLDNATETDGPQYALTDNEMYCAYGRFCDNGDQIWNEVTEPGERHAELALYMAHHCPSGRLLVWDRSTRKPIETAEPATLSLIEDAALGISGPLMLRGGIRVQSANGESYEVRNPSDPVPLRRLVQQALLRRQPRLDQVQGRAGGMTSRAPRRRTVHRRGAAVWVRIIIN